MTILHAILSIASGSLVGFTLGLVGGGGSILAVPLLVYVVGVPSAHIAIGTSAQGHFTVRARAWPARLAAALAATAIALVPIAMCAAGTPTT